MLVILLCLRQMIMDIIKRLPAAGSQIGLFSATLHSVEIKEMAGRITRHATWIDLKGKDAVPDVRRRIFAGKNIISQGRIRIAIVSLYFLFFLFYADGRSRRYFCESDDRQIVGTA